MAKESKVTLVRKESDLIRVFKWIETLLEEGRINEAKRIIKEQIALAEK